MCCRQCGSWAGRETGRAAISSQILTDTPKTSDQREAVLATAGFAVTYWVAQGTAISYPNTAFYDPEFLTAHSFTLGLPIQAHFEIGFLSVITLASWLALRKSAHWSN